MDYSGRSVIVVGPELKMSEWHACPSIWLLELFRPFVIAELIKKRNRSQYPGAGKLVDEKIPEVWAILEEVIKDKRVLLNRAAFLLD